MLPHVILPEDCLCFDKSVNRILITVFYFKAFLVSQSFSSNDSAVRVDLNQFVHLP
jgi:hypothetical protein